MSSRKLVCAALSALFIWMMNAGAAEETGKNLILTYETDDHPLTRGAVMEKLAQLDIV